MSIAAETILYPTLCRILEDIRQCDGETPDYEKRTHHVYGALHLASTLGLPCGIRVDGTNDGTSWPVAVINLPNGIGEVAWYCAAYPDKWDGHTTEEKYKRIAQFGEYVARKCDQ